MHTCNTVVLNARGKKITVPPDIMKRSESFNNWEKSIQFCSKELRSEGFFVNATKMDTHNLIEYLSNRKYRDTDILASLLEELKIDVKETRDIIETYLKSVEKISKNNTSYSKEYRIPCTWNKYQLNMLLKRLNVVDYKIDKCVLTVYVKLKKYIESKKNYNFLYEKNVINYGSLDTKVPSIPNDIPYNIIFKVCTTLPEFEHCVSYQIQDYNGGYLIKFEMPIRPDAPEPAMS
jgi:hypothetical protein